MPGRNLNLLSLDGGGVRGLSSLYILQRIMISLDPDDPPKPCDYFDMIGGTSTGGLIAIMLGRLEMSIDECIEAYTDVSGDVFHRKRQIPMGIRGYLMERYDGKALEFAVKKVLKERILDEDALLKNPRGTKVFVCCTSGETSETSLLRTWHTVRGDPDLYRTVRIWEAACATFAAPTFFDPISIGEPKKRFLDGGVSASNPVRHLWGEATDLLPRGESLQDNLGCLISIGTGQPDYKPFEEISLGIGRALLAISTETEAIANQFHREQSPLFESNICFRFNAPRGLDNIGLAETEQLSAIRSTTNDYLHTQVVQSDLRACVQQLSERKSVSEPTTQSAGMILQAIEQVNQNEDNDFCRLIQDSRWQLANSEDDCQDLLNNISPYQPQRVHCKINMQKTKGTTHWIEEDILSWVHSSSQAHSDFEKCLWISGIVGCGKTFLANTAIQTLLDFDHQKPVAHFYFHSNNHNTLTTEALLRSYTKQFLRHVYRTHEKPPDKIADAIKRMFGSRHYQIDCIELVENVLKPLILEFKSSFLVVDGLDLCSPQEYRFALECLSSLLQKTSVKIIICGRDELNVTERLPGSMRLKVTRAKTKGDLALFVKQYIEDHNIGGPISNDSSTVARMADTLIDQAGGMFLWARLQIDILWETCTTDDEIDLILSKLPRDLDETYERCLERVEEKQQQYSLRVLRYVCEAQTPLTIDALGEALATDPNTGKLKYDHIPANATIVRSGANLVVFDEVERLVFPAHHSVKQFLNSSRASILEQLHGAEVSNAVLGVSHKGHDEILQSPLARANKHQDHSSVAYSEDHDSGYSSLQTQPLVEKQEGSDSQTVDDDTKSVGTIDTDIQSSIESPAFSNVREAAAREIARAFIGDSEISNLYDEGLRKMHVTRFIESHRRLLKLFYLEATKDAELASHHVVLRFLRSRTARKRVSARIVHARKALDEEAELDVGSRSQSLRLIDGLLTDVDKRHNTSQWTEAQQNELDTWPPIAQEGFALELSTDNLDNDEDFDDFDAGNEEESLRMDDLPALVRMTAFLMHGRAFQIYKSNLQRLAYGKSIAPTAFRDALAVNDLALAIKLLETESDAVTQSKLGFEHVKEPLAMGFSPAEIVRLIIDKGKNPSWLEESDKASSVRIWEEARELMRAEQSNTSSTRATTEHLAATDRQALEVAQGHDDSVPPLDDPELLEEQVSEGKSGYRSSLANSPALLKRKTSRVNDFMVWTGLISGPLEAGCTRITWKNRIGHVYTSDVKQFKTGDIAKIFGDLERYRGIKIVSMGNTAGTAGDSLWIALSNKLRQWTSKNTKKPPILPQQNQQQNQQQTQSVDPSVQPQQPPSSVEKGDILMLCMPRGSRSKILYQEDLYARRIDNDHALSILLRDMFKTHRGAFRSYLSLRRIKDIRLVEFILLKNRPPFVRNSSCSSDNCMCLPPEDKIDPKGKEYRCSSSGGPRVTCPLPDNVLMDYYKNPQLDDPPTAWLLKLMPKRMCGRLEGTPSGPAQGWGISYEEGWDYRKTRAILLIVFFGGSLSFGILWTVYKKDIQGAFGVSAWWLGASTFLLWYIAIPDDDV